MGNTCGKLYIPDIFYLSWILMLGTFSVAYGLKIFRNSDMLPYKVIFINYFIINAINNYCLFDAGSRDNWDIFRCHSHRNIYDVGSYYRYEYSQTNRAERICPNSWLLHKDMDCTDYWQKSMVDHSFSFCAGNIGHHSHLS